MKKKSCVNKMQYHWPCTRILTLNQINLHGKKARKDLFYYSFLWCIYRLKSDAFSDIDNFVDNLNIQIFDIDNLPIIWNMPIYWLSIIFSIFSPLAECALLFIYLFKLWRGALFGRIIIIVPTKSDRKAIKGAQRHQYEPFTQDQQFWKNRAVK